ncbi:hypothetical protein Pmar_PMAR007104, partial [Perkinsus marinus ATCC 50983]
PSAIDQFAYSAANFYDVLLSYTCTGTKQKDMINDAYQDFLHACMQLSNTQIPPHI